MTNPTSWSILLSLSRILHAGLIAAIVNVLVYFIALALDWMPSMDINPQLGRPIGVGEVVGATVPGAVGATVLFALLARFTRRPTMIFRSVALVVLLLSFATPLTLPGAPLSLVLTLEVMHVVAAAIIIFALTARARASKRA